MSSAWDKAEQLVDKRQGGGNKFVRLQNDGDTVCGVFVGDPFTREVHWAGGKYVNCSGSGCSECLDGVRAAVKTALNFYVPADGEMRIIEGGVAWFKSVLKVREKFGLEKWIFEVQRNGEKGSQKTSYTIMPHKEMDETAQMKVLAVMKHDLADELGGDPATPQPDRSAQAGLQEDGDNVPF